MNPTAKVLLLAFALAGLAMKPFAQGAQPDPNLHIYLLFGQSNMAGGGAVSDSPSVDCDTTPRVKVLAFSDCTAGPNCKDYVMRRTVDQWYTAFPPLHDCNAGLEGISPGDWFGKTLIDSVRSDISIGLVPCALSGMALNVFLKGSTATSTVGPSQVRGKNAYSWMLNRAKLAQQRGVIKGILLHQGESGTGTSQAWDAMAMQIFNDLKTDLGLDPKTVLVVGQLRSDSRSPAPNNTSFNNMIAGMPAKYPQVGMASSQGLSGNGRDIWHFNPSAMRELGRRYAKALLALSDNTVIPRKSGSVGLAPKPAQGFGPYGILPEKENLKVFSLDGKQLPAENVPTREGASRDVFLIKGSNGKALQVLPE
jgi:Carbohydrate esterase, sialic acid-specific acetylesterase